MKNTIKNLVAGILTLSVFTMTTNVYADAEIVDVSGNQSVEEYLNICIPKHLNALEITVSGNVSYSELIPLYDFDSFEIVGSLVVVFDNNEPIGKVELYNNENQYSSYFDPTITSDIDMAFQNADSIALGYYNESFLLYSNVYGYDYVDGLLTDEYPSSAPSSICAAEICNTLDSNSAQPAATLGSCILSNFVSNYHVPNATVVVDGDSKGLCWAATFAMLMNYRFDTEYLATDVYNIAAANNLPLHSSNVANYLNVSNTVINDAMTPDAIFQQLRNDNPMSISVKKSATGAKHSIVVYGITIEHNRSTLSLDDPNTQAGSLIINVAPNQITNTIEHDRFDEWYTSFYLN